MSGDERLWTTPFFVDLNVHPAFFLLPLWVLPIKDVYLCTLLEVKEKRGMQKNKYEVKEKVSWMLNESRIIVFLTFQLTLCWVLIFETQVFYFNLQREGKIVYEDRPVIDVFTFKLIFTFVYKLS